MNTSEIIRNVYPDATSIGEPKIFPHSEITRFENKGKKLLAKILEKEIVLKANPEDRQKFIDYLGGAVPHYYNTLKKLGVPVPPFHELIVSNGKLVEFGDDLGEINISEKLKTVSPDETKKLIHLMLRSTSPVFQNQSGPIGFDANGENFVISAIESSEKAYFIDYFSENFFS